MYGGLVLLQNLHDIKLIIFSKRSLTGTPINLFEFILSYMSSIFQTERRITCVYFGVFTVFTLIFCLPWGTKLNKRNKNGAVLASYKALFKKIIEQ